MSKNPTDPMPLSHSKFANQVSEPRDMRDDRSLLKSPVVASSTNVTLRARVLGWLRYLDVVLVAIAVIPALALGAPVLGYCIGAGGWIFQRVIGEIDRRWLRNLAEPRTQLGASLFEGFARTWLLAGVIITSAAIGGRADGLTAAIVICGAYSVALAIKVLSGPPRKVTQ
jgi:hypothetical protein